MIVSFVTITFRSFHRENPLQHSAQFQGERRLRTLTNKMTRQQRREVLGADNYSVIAPVPTRRDESTISGIASRYIQRPSLFRRIALVGLLAVTACGPAPQMSKSATNGGAWHEFQGTWTAAGSRYTMRLDADRRASIANFNGSLLLAGPSRPAVGFRGEAIVFSDSASGLVGRAVWTDEHGDQAYSELRGEGTAQNNKITGTFVGGTGRYSGATGTYEFSWRFVLENEEGLIQGQSMGLNGRVRLDSQQAGVDDRGAPRS
jgi:hypothetical protein